MPRGKRAEQPPHETKPPEEAKSNKLDSALVKGFVERLEELAADKLSIMMTAVANCKPLTSLMKEVFDEAKEQAGISKKALRAVLKARLLERKARAARDDLDDVETFDQIREALGDLASTPLGAAALEDAASKNTKLLREGMGQLAHDRGDDNGRPWPDDQRVPVGEVQH